MNNVRIKKLSIVLIAALLLAMCAFGCKKNAPAKWRPGEPLNKDKIKICAIYLDKAGNGYYSIAHDNGLKETQKKLGLRDDQILRKFNVYDADDGMVEHTMRDAIAKGANVIIATTWGYMDVCEKLSAIFPNVVFAHASGYKSNETNFTNYFGRLYQARYLSGIAAGLNTKTGKIGFVAAQDNSNSEVTGGLNAFALGVEKVNPNARVYAAITYSWFDPEGERAAARKLIKSGCDVIAQHTDTPEPQIAAEEAGVLSIGNNLDMSADAPNAVLTSAVWNWGAYYSFLIQSVIDGSFNTKPYYGGLADGMVDIAPLSAFAAQGTAEAVNIEKDRILNRNFNIFEGELKTNDGRVIGSSGGTLSDDEITGEINWYYRNITVLK